MKKRILVIILFSFLFSGCDEVIEWSPVGDPGQRIVVEATLTDEFKNQEILLTGITQDINGKGQAISGAFISVESDSGIHVFWEDTLTPGRYLSANPFAIQTHQWYTLTIDWEQKQYEAQAIGVDILPMRTFGFLPFGETDSLYIPGVGVEYSESEQAMYDIWIDWSETGSGPKTQARQIHFVFSSINIGQLFGPEQEIVPFPHGSKVTIRKFALEPTYAEFLRTLVIETRWKGGFFEESNGNLATNISNGGLGFFAVCPVLMDTLTAR